MKTIEITREDPAIVLKAYADLTSRNAKIFPVGAVGWSDKGKLSKSAGALFAKEISSRFDEFLDNDDALRAATTGDNAGTLAGTLVSQRTLELFAYEFPIISKVYTDFSDEPALFNQTENTRIVITPAVQTYNATVGADGRPAGWDTVVAAQNTDVPITLNEHVGIPIVFDSNVMSGTLRKLFDEHAPAAAYALAKYFVDKIYALFTPANYNGYAAIVAGKVPAAYASYKIALADLGRSTMTAIGGIFNQNEVPLNNRTCLWNTAYFAKMSNDPSLVTFFAGQRAPEIVTDSQLPRMARFQPVEAPNLPGTNNLVGMALHRAGGSHKGALATGLEQGNAGRWQRVAVTLTDPKTGLSMISIQYVNHTGGYAESRLEVLLGAGVGDKRGGLCLVS